MIDRKDCNKLRNATWYKLKMKQEFVDGEIAM